MAGGPAEGRAAGDVPTVWMRGKDMVFLFRKLDASEPRTVPLTGRTKSNPATLVMVRVTADTQRVKPLVGGNPAVGSEHGHTVRFG